ncbi:iron-containing alcohol dehydrogenase [Terribacillus saccharophilus]|uniref:Alcohol dehydrogenase, class IV n=1 Tax=Terribacillus saccharophilus TaxID=361277 RepID=A0AAX2EIC1_9BACI|nr:iron-containing alcohol dehydrogenase [Terribacillus goriensis]SEN86721.1 Alcohol dehydrogenase, class IV [Terribacillus saccharophilus]
MNRFTIPRDIYFGEGALEVLESIKGNKAMLVIGGASARKSGVLDRVQSHLEKAGIQTKVIEGIREEPTTDKINEALEDFEQFGPDWVIGIGGGSVMDAAKAMWVFYEHPNLSFEDATKPFELPALRSKAKFIGIPTTSGSASEISNLSVVTNSKTKIKYPLADFELTPDIAIIDPITIFDMPKHITAFTGMDAVTHCIESYVAKPRTVFTDSLAIEGAEILRNHLIASYNGERTSREQVHYAQAMAGMAFANAVLGNVHSMAHKSGPTFGIAHGLANAIYLPYVIQFNRTVSEERYARIARRLQLNGTTDAELTDSLIQWIRDLNREMDIPLNLRDFGVAEDLFYAHVEDMAANAVTDPCTGTNPRETSVEQMKKLYVAAFEGEDVDF